MANSRSFPKFTALDPMYGRVEFDEQISRLIHAPLVQRLRHVRLSNIDSIGLPGISGLSRFEHVLGTAHLASQVGYVSALSKNDRIALQAAALLHDWAITAFGHLVEEAFAYIGSTFHHEDKLADIAKTKGNEVGGINRQVLCGRETGLGDWCSEVFRGDAQHYIEVIVKTIRGERGGPFGCLVSGDIDLDNIDNLHRISFHMGLPVAKDAPLRLAQSMQGVAEDGSPIFAAQAAQLLGEWIELRRVAYTNLMLTPQDFSAKLMLLYATVSAMQTGEFDERDWSMTDVQFVMRLLNSRSKDAKDAAERWMSGELWVLSPLLWIESSAPAYSRILEFSEFVSKKLDRRFFAYRIKDKRQRELKISFEGGVKKNYGGASPAWVLGVGSPIRRALTATENLKIRQFAEEFFQSRVVESISTFSESHAGQEGLI